MSNALVTVTFKDGLKLYSQYQGSSDTFYYSLFDSAEKASSLNRHVDPDWKALSRYEKPKELEDVHVHNNYGAGGDKYLAKACRHTKQLRVFHDWLDYGYGDPFTKEDWLKSLDKEMA